MNIKYSKRIYKAINRAAELHDGQFRKGAKVPFAVHPFSVAFILQRFTDDEDVIIAGLMHDTLEDVPGYTAEQLKEEFGERVAELVIGVSEPKGEWQLRKDAYIEKLTTDPRECLLICAADKLHNITSLIEDYKIVGDDLWKNFTVGPELEMEFHEKLVKILKERLDSPITAELEAVHKKAKEIFLKNEK